MRCFQRCFSAFKEAIRAAAAEQDVSILQKLSTFGNTFSVLFWQITSRLFLRKTQFIFFLWINGKNSLDTWLVSCFTKKTFPGLLPFAWWKNFPRVDKSFEIFANQEIVLQSWQIFFGESRYFCFCNHQLPTHPNLFSSLATTTQETQITSYFSKVFFASKKSSLKVRKNWKFCGLLVKAGFVWYQKLETQQQEDKVKKSRGANSRITKGINLNGFFQKTLPDLRP